MALDVWFREDVANILHSVNLSGSNMASIVTRELAKGDLDAAHVQEHIDLYEQGCLDALRAVAAAFGIIQPQPALVARNNQDDNSAQVMVQSWNAQRKISI